MEGFRSMGKSCPNRWSKLKRFVTKRIANPARSDPASDEAPVIQPQEGGDRGPNKIAQRSWAIFINLNPERLVHGADIGCLFTFGASGHIE